jgi:hypothetical protein
MKYCGYCGHEIKQKPVDKNVDITKQLTFQLQTIPDHENKMHIIDFSYKGHKIGFISNGEVALMEGEKKFKVVNCYKYASGKGSWFKIVKLNDEEDEDWR